MNWNVIEGEWHELAGKAKQTWAELTDDDLRWINGDRERLLGRLQKRYGWIREDAASKIDEWADSLTDLVRG